MAMLHVAPAALDFQELLVADGDVLGGQLGSAVLSMCFPSRFSSAFALAASVPCQEAGGDAQVAVQDRASRRRSRRAAPGACRS